MSRTIFGVCNSYAAFKAISKKLFEKIPDEDWRKTTWIAPEDAGKAPGKKYRTILTDEEFKKIPEYTGIKFRCKMVSNAILMLAQLQIIL